MPKGQPRRDITGERNGHIEAIRLDRRENGVSYWVVRCDCGTEWVVALGNFSKTHQCQACKHKSLGESRRTHGMSRSSKIYQLWRQKRSEMCDRWKNDIRVFIDESGASSRPNRSHIMAVDDSQPIGPRNYQWSTRNRGRKRYTVDGFTGHASAFADRYRVSRERIRQLLANEGGDMERVVARLSRPRKERMLEGLERGRETIMANAAERRGRRRCNDDGSASSKQLIDSRLETMFRRGGVLVFAVDPELTVKRLGVKARSMGFQTEITKREECVALHTIDTGCFDRS